MSRGHKQWIDRRPLVGIVGADLLEPLEKVVRIGRKGRVACVMHAIKGVPTKQIAVLVDEAVLLIMSQCDGRVVAAPDGSPVELALESTVYTHRDGTDSRRLAIRRYRAADDLNMQAPAWLELLAGHGGATVTIRPLDESIWPQGWDYERYTVPLDADRDLDEIVRWHWRRWYRFLAEDDIASLGAILAGLLGESPTLADANRAASRLLYQSARAAGWRKLSERERALHGVASHWIRTDTLNAIRFRATGAGEWTHRSASDHGRGGAHHA